MLISFDPPIPTPKTFFEKGQTIAIQPNVPQKTAPTATLGWVVQEHKAVADAKPHGFLGWHKMTPSKI